MTRAREIARIRQNGHDMAGTATPRFFQDRYTECTIGMAGQLAFAARYGFAESPVKAEYGELVDFVFSLGGEPHTIKIRTARNPVYLLCKVCEMDDAADILVLAYYYSETLIEFLGWAYKDEVAMGEKRNFGYGINNYTLPQSELRPMEELRDILEERDA